MSPAAGPAVPDAAPASRPGVLGFLGIHSAGRPDQAVGQDDTLAGLFARDGYRVRRASGVRHPLPRTLHQVAALLAWRRVDVVVVACFSGRSFWISEFGTLLGRLGGRKVVVFLHGGNLPVFGPEHRPRVDRVLRRADLVLAPSDYLAGTFREWGIDVRVIPNVLALDEYTYRHRDRVAPRLLWMRTFQEHYDPITALRCLARVREVHPGARMTMAGADHGLLDATVAEAERLGLSGAVDFPGFLDAAGKRRAFAEHDVFLNTNVVDNMPVSVLEAAASGLVLVATAVGGIPDLVSDGEDALLVPVGDDEAMARAVLHLVADADAASRLSAGARALAERSGWRRVRASWERELRFVAPDRRWG